jgi:hypothetical protein
VGCGFESHLFDWYLGTEIPTEASSCERMIGRDNSMCWNLVDKLP